MIIRYRAAGILLLLLTLLSINKSIAQADIGKLKCVCIDAGHGGKDPGAVGLKTYEKHIVLAIALKLGDLIKKEYPDIKIVYTRDKDVFIDLDKRGKIANDNKADLFISIHINSNNSRSASGLETYVLGLHRSKENLQVAMKENAVIKYENDYSVKYAGFDPHKPESYIIFSFLQNLYLEKSLILADFVQEEMVDRTKRIDRGVGQAGYLVLKDAAMPAILVESGFISNANEEQFLMTSAAQEKIALSILKAIGKYKASIEKNNNLLAHKDTESANDAGQQDRSDVQDNDSPFYAVQVASSSSKIKNAADLCTGEKVCEFNADGRYRYYVAQSDDFEEVVENLKKVKGKVRDCFIIAIYKGKTISVAEAKKMERKK